MLENELQCEDSTSVETFSVEQTLEQRGQRYGAFPDHAKITQNLKAAMVDSANWETLASDQKEALEMIVHKIGRILNGDPDYADSWHDIAGYSTLVEERLNKENWPSDEQQDKAMQGCVE